jgi:hypothetical protein
MPTRHVDVPHGSSPVAACGRLLGPGAASTTHDGTDDAVGCVDGPGPGCGPGGGRGTQATRAMPRAIHPQRKDKDVISDETALVETDKQVARELSGGLVTNNPPKHRPRMAMPEGRIVFTLVGIRAKQAAEFGEFCLSVNLVR